MSKSIFMLFGLVFLLTISAYSQKSVENSNHPIPQKINISQKDISKEKIIEMPDAGTYQIISNNKDYPEQLTNRSLALIESYREESREKVIKIGKYTYVKIPSKETINQSDFKPLEPEKIYVEGEVELK